MAVDQKHSSADDRAAFRARRRGLLKGLAVGAPAIITLRGGRAWAVSSCGETLRASGEDLTENEARVRQILQDAGKDHEGDVLNSCLISGGFTTN